MDTWYTFLYRVELYFNQQHAGTAELGFVGPKEPSATEIAQTVLERAYLREWVLSHPATAWSAEVVTLNGPFQGVTCMVPVVTLPGGQKE